MYHTYRISPKAAWAAHRFLKHRDTPLAGESRTSDWRLLAAEADSLRARCREVQHLGSIFDQVCQYAGIAPDQHRGEMLPFLELLGARRPKVLCEIGSARGGSLFLFSHVAHPEARILSIDISNHGERRALFRRLVQPDQHLTCIEGSSHSRATHEQFRSWVGNDPLDFLFIDGDHSLEGVASDYERYGSFVRSAGLIAFHDIVPDYRTRYGIGTGTYAGGVPTFWSRLSKDTTHAYEFIDHPLQDGYGIGAIEVTR
ncbi:MAG: class I SAM-dependent methyltransferase [Gammaproteobacteria bacterium]